MGDIIHTLPALTDAGNALSSITFDWVVEENFAEIEALVKLNDAVETSRFIRKVLFSK